MSKLDELIKELCPNGVEFHKIKEVYKRLRGTSITASKMKEINNPEGDIKIFAGGKTVIDTFENDIPKANVVRVPAVLVQSRGVIDVLYYDKPFTFKNEMWAYTDDNSVSVKFLYYVMKNNIHTFRDDASGMGSLPQISLKVTEEFEIPVPPLEVQKEIVDILDKFTEYVTELQAELQAREKQYSYYRDKLLSEVYLAKYIETFYVGKSVNNKLIRVSLGKVSGYSKERISANELNITNYIGVDNLLKNKKGKTDSNYVPTEGYLTKFQSGDILIGNIRPYLRKIWKADCTGGTNGDVLVIHINDEYREKINSDYLYHVLADESFFEYDVRYSKGAKMPRGDKSQIMKYEFFLPPLEVQEHIVKILDKFEILINNIGFGLPKEIELREKQYRYYRDKLLDFPK